MAASAITVKMTAAGTCLPTSLPSKVGKPSSKSKLLEAVFI